MLLFFFFSNLIISPQQAGLPTKMQKSAKPDCANPENIHTPPMEGFFCFAPPPLPPGNFGLFSYIASKNLAFKTSLPLGISNDLPWGRYGLFLELHILQ